ncbi:hypothetical protein LNP00_06475 [Fructobacillus sp. M158]|uniref:hypothetical protein n=1 Tax=Fructobacillus parabroussonetiae TaxID=2713174 RepID=UPI00200AF8E1|nr:hypothetical protein [Fructobacillus parabroussonetiae]MCK8617995.1 hypothetical protein [Fructobacillus parabroussonetiae]
MNRTKIDVRGLKVDEIDYLKQQAKLQNMSLNAYLVSLLQNVIQQKKRHQAELLLSSPLNELIEANNRSVQTQNANTVAIGEMLKEMTMTFSSQLNRIENDRH